MNASHIQSACFARGPDRRTLFTHPENERRLNERRLRPVTWIPLFKNIDEKSVNLALAETEVLTIPAGSPLLKPGEPNQSVYIPQGVKHRLENFTNKPIRIVEVQTGSYLGENDIERFDDDFKKECRTSI